MPKSAVKRYAVCGDRTTRAVTRSPTEAPRWFRHRCHVGPRPLLVAAIDKGRDEVAAVEQAVTVPISVLPGCVINERFFVFSTDEHVDEIGCIKTSVQVRITKERRLAFDNPHSPVLLIDLTVCVNIVFSRVLATSNGSSQRVDVNNIKDAVVIKVARSCNPG